MLHREMSALRFNRLIAGLSQFELSRSTRISQSIISLIERGFYKPNAAHVKKISRVLGKAPEELFPESDGAPALR
jgi:transcriptional regulator with XRE-family HTH domain